MSAIRPLLQPAALCPGKRLDRPGLAGPSSGLETRDSAERGGSGVLILQRTFVLWWHTGTHAAREEADGVQTTATAFEMGPARLLIASLGALQDRGHALEVGKAAFGIKRQRGDQRVGGIAYLAQRERGFFPPAAARFGGLRTND